MTGGRWLITAWAGFTVLAVVVVLGLSEQAALDDPVQKGARGEVTGLDPLSLLRGERLAGAIRALEARYPNARTVNLRVTPTGVSAQLRMPDYKLAYADVDLDLAVTETSVSESVQEGPRLGSIPVGAPARIIGIVNASTRTRPADVRDVTLSAGSEPQWTLTLARGTRPDQRSFIGSLSGESVTGLQEVTS